MRNGAHRAVAALLRSRRSVARRVLAGGGGPASRDDLAALLDAYRRGDPVTSIADAFEMDFDSVARLVIVHDIARDVPLARRPGPDQPAELDDPDWIRSGLETGWTVADIARRVAASEDAVTAALTRHGFTVASSDDSTPHLETERSAHVKQFRIGARRAQAARSSFDRAVAMQASAVAGLASSGLTVPAIADRLDLDDVAVEALLDEPVQPAADDP